jgi:hypothetical protein
LYFVFLVLFSAYDGKVTSKSRGNSVISQSNLYEDVRSQISEDLGWSSSEFDSDSTTDYENSTDFDIIEHLSLAVCAKNQYPLGPV